jgi:DNA-binding response OmpR family regulator
MPEKDGFELLREIRSLGDESEVPVICDHRFM